MRMPTFAEPARRDRRQRPFRARLPDEPGVVPLHMESESDDLDDGTDDGADDDGAGESGYEGDDSGDEGGDEAGGYSSEE